MDAIKILLLGTGTAFNHDGRGSQAIHLGLPGGRGVLVDVGPTAVQALRARRLPIGAIDTVVLTHLHGDHIAGWPFLLLNLVILERRDRPIDVIGPVGTAQSLDRLCSTCYGDVLDNLEFEVRVRELPVEAADAIPVTQGIELSVLPMEHHPTSLGLRFRIPGEPGAADRTLAVSGDTDWCEALERLADGVDLLITECTTIERQEYAHLSLEELRQGVDRLAADRIVLVHLTDGVAESLALDPVARLSAGHDGLELTL